MLVAWIREWIESDGEVQMTREREREGSEGLRAGVEAGCLAEERMKDEGVVWERVLVI